VSARQAVLVASTGSEAWTPRVVVTGNGARRVFPSLTDRFWEQVVEGAGDCWLWGGDKTDDGYGRFSINPVYVGAHRWAYQLMRAEIPEGLDLDHLCRVTSCVNPWHLDPVTREENIRRAFLRGTCDKGHSMADAILRQRSGRIARSCRPCTRERQRNHMRKVRAERVGQVVP
jgi:HNH endonuclease